MNSNLTETSGLTKSKTHKNTYYAHNDSGGSAKLFLLDQTGKNISELKVRGAKNKDWEDITTIKCPNKNTSCLVIGDFGNNRYKRKKLKLYIVEEPEDVNQKEVIVKKEVKFSLDTDRQNFEALFSYNGEIFIISKMNMRANARYNGSEGIAILYHLDIESKKAKKVSTINLNLIDGIKNMPRRFTWVTGAEISPDKKSLYILTYGLVIKFDFDQNIFTSRWDKYSILIFKEQRKAESISFYQNHPIIVSEGLYQPIYQIKCLDNDELPRD